MQRLALRPFVAASSTLHSEGRCEQTESDEVSPDWLNEKAERQFLWVLDANHKRLRKKCVEINRPNSFSALTALIQHLMLSLAHPHIRSMLTRLWHRPDGRSNQPQASSTAVRSSRRDRKLLRELVVVASSSASLIESLRGCATHSR